MALSGSSNVSSTEVTPPRFMRTVRVRNVKQWRRDMMVLSIAIRQRTEQ